MPLERGQLATSTEWDRRHLPAMLSGRVRGGTADVMDVNPFAVIATVIFAESFHTCAAPS